MRKILLLLVALGLALGACGDDDDDDGATGGASGSASEAEADDEDTASGDDDEAAAGGDDATTTTVPDDEAPLQPEEIDVDASAYCATWFEIRNLPADEDVRAYNQELLALGERLLAEAPEEIRDDVELTLAEVRRQAEGGSVEEFSDELQAAQRRLNAYARRSCAHENAT